MSRQQRAAPQQPADAKQVQDWIADLDSSQFAKREKATRELKRLGELGEPALKKALKNRPSLEARSRLNGLLNNLPGPSPELIRSLRAIEVLERIGVADARDVLNILAKGAPEAQLTQEAMAALDRLRARPKASQ